MGLRPSAAPISRTLHPSSTFRTKITRERLGRPSSASITSRRRSAITSGEVVLEGTANVRDLEVQYDVQLPRDQGFETLAGFVLAQLGKIPQGGESFEYEGRRYTVLQMEGHRIIKVKIEKIGSPAELPKLP